MKKLMMYNSHPIDGQSFKGVKSVVIPRQNMTLQEIVKRFIKKESLPEEKEGFYHEGDIDLEKFRGQDMVVQDEIIESVKADVSVKKAKADKLLQQDPKPIQPPKQPGENT